MPIVPDTNVLIRLVSPADALYLTARRAVARLQNEGETFVLLPQNLYEFWAVATRPATARGGLGLTPAQCRRRLQTFQKRFPLLPDPPDLAARWLALCGREQVSGVNAHDARLVAAIMAHGLSGLLTFNATDFARYKTLKVWEPGAVVAAPQT